MKGNNGELQELYGEQELIALIKKGRLRWLGHVERMDDNRVPQRMLCGRPGGRKEDRLRWLDYVEEFLRERGVRRWRTKAVDTNE
jgi:hypothetical protein